jgi:hypothetical protein
VLHGETVLFDLVCDDQFAVLEIGDPQIVRSTKQRTRDFMLKRQVPLFEIANVDVSHHDILQTFSSGAKYMPLTTIQANARIAKVPGRDAAPRRFL